MTDINALEEEVKHLEEEEEHTTAGLTRLQLIVFACLIAFFILAAYGFFLIYSLTKDVSKLAVDVNSMSISIDKNMEIIATSMGDITGRMSDINSSTELMAVTAQNMADSTQHMATSTDNMRYDVRRLNNSISGPMDAIGSFFPGGRKIRNPPPPVYYPPAFQMPPNYQYQTPTVE